MNYINPLGSVYTSKYVYYDNKYRRKVRKAVPIVWDGICFFETYLKLKKTPTVVLERFKDNKSPPYIYGKTHSNGIIRIDVAFKLRKIINNLCHEMVHFEQIQRGDLKWENKIVIWKGERMNFSLSAKENFDSYRMSPWEEEAFERERDLEEAFINHILSR